MVTKEFNPFLVYSAQLQGLLTKASKQKNPALWLHQNNARTALFQLEALTRIHDLAFDEKIFVKWHKRFKKMEDVFGEIDYYLVLEKEFKANKKIDRVTVAYFTEKVKNKLEKCNIRLQEKEWLEGKLGEFDVRLKEYTVVYNKEYLNELKLTIKADIESILIFIQKIDYSFSQFEKQVHEVRRKLRWLSIYSQALNGLIQLKKTTKKTKYQINYFTKDILKSPYNKLPVKPKNVMIMEFDHDSFFALSWIIKELGILKDSGLRIIALTEAIVKTSDYNEQQAKEKAHVLLGVEKNFEEKVLKQVSETVKTFILKDKILDSLVIK
jgi:hypothetical protein